jgi:hypothetical protein
MRCAQREARRGGPGAGKAAEARRARRTLLSLEAQDADVGHICTREQSDQPTTKPTEPETRSGTDRWHGPDGLRTKLARLLLQRLGRNYERRHFCWFLRLHHLRCSDLKHRADLYYYCQNAPDSRTAEKDANSIAADEACRRWAPRGRNDARGENICYAERNFSPLATPCEPASSKNRSRAPLRDAQARLVPLDTTHTTHTHARALTPGLPAPRAT